MRWTPLLLALLLAGCPSTGIPTTPRPKASAPGQPAIAATPLPPGASPTPAPLASNGLPATTPPVLTTPAPTLVDLSKATLTGKVKGPAGLIANNGGSIISDNGAGIVANNGGGYRHLMALDQVPLAGATVALVDAAGQPVLGADGKPLTAKTDAQGQYAFFVVLPPQTLVARVDLGAKGALSSLTTAKDVDVVSTLTTGYILDQYVKGDPKILAKLPADVEADTRAKAAAALTAAPDDLTPAKVVATVEGLRKANKAFDDQMETVKRILIAAGVSNLGVGLPATEVYMRRFFASDVGRDGTLYSYDADDGFIWRIGPDGKLAPYVGNGEKANDAAKAQRGGVKPEEVALGYVTMLKLDAQDRMVVNEDQHGVWRVEADGAITQLHTPAAIAAAFGSSATSRGVEVRDDGTLIVMKDGGLWALPPGGTATKLADASGSWARFGLVELAGAARWLGLDFTSLTEFKATGAPTVLVSDTDARLRIEPGTGQAGYSAMDHRGNFFYTGKDNQVHRLRPDGTDEVVFARNALTKGMAWVLEGKDGKLYAADSDQSNYGSSLVRRFDGATSTIVAGLDGLPKGFTSDGRIPLLYPKGLEVGPDGTMWIADAGALMEIPPGGAAKVIGAKDTFLPDAFESVQFTGVRRAKDGTLYARALGRSEYMLKQAADGSWKKLFSLPRAFANDWNIAMHAWDLGPDGTIVCSKIGTTTGGAWPYDVSVVRFKPGDTTPSVLVPSSEGMHDLAKVTFAPDGRLWIFAAKGPAYKPVRYLVDDAGKLTEVPADTLVGEAKDAQGRVYEGDASSFVGGNFGDRHIRRQAAGAAVEVLAGQGAPLLGGTGLDDSIGWAEDLRFDGAGNLYIRDTLRRQVRRIPKERL